MSKKNIYFNRELSWLEFNQRVLEEAQDKNNPLLERLKFLSIVITNLDEFFMVRVASIVDQIFADFTGVDPSGMTPQQQLDAIIKRVDTMMVEVYSTYRRSLLPLLKKEGIQILHASQISHQQKEYLQDIFMSQIYPVITPMGVDQTRPFPLIFNRSLNVAVLLYSEKNNEKIFGTLQVPSVLDRFIELPQTDDVQTFILLEEVLLLFLDEFFKGHRIESVGFYRMTRNADLSIDEEGAEDLLEEIELSIQKRKWGNPVRLEYQKPMDEELLNRIIAGAGPFEGGIYPLEGSLDLSFLFKLYGRIDRPELKYETTYPIYPIIFKDQDIFRVLRKQNVILHHPYDSFEIIVDLVAKASIDPDVLAIKQTLYRVSGNSPIIESLARASENGKQVTVLVELKARFDEENNIIWAKRLEKAGCHVIYGLVGLKTHSKLLLIIRKEDMGIRRYVHLGTGNYNDVTANFYTDTGLMTTDPHIGSDASAIFNMISGFSEIQQLSKIDFAPINLRESLYELIDVEINSAKRGEKAHIIAKMNSLLDADMIAKLYDASREGVEIQLIVRGICCLIPGIKNMSQHIEVRSIVGRYLEHSRIFYFYHEGNQKVFMSSADWMPRNLNRRIELMFPIEQEDNKKEVLQILCYYLQDTEKSRILQKDGTYKRVDGRGRERLNVQAFFHELTRKKNKQHKEAMPIFQPVNGDFLEEDH